VIAPVEVMANASIKPRERVLAPEFFDALEASVHRFGGVWISPSMMVERTRLENGEEDVRIVARSLFGHLCVFTIELDLREPDLAQSWLRAAMATFDRLDLTPLGVAESIVSYNMLAHREHTHPLSWVETCAALGFRREEEV
jgi:hypothetical protein